MDVKQHDIKRLDFGIIAKPNIFSSHKTYIYRHSEEMTTKRHLEELAL